MELCSIASGSSGNCICVGSDDCHVLIDAGISGKRIENGLNSMDLKTADMQGILITHEHIDHIAGLGVIARRYGIPMYATGGTVDAILHTKSVGKIDEALFQVIEPEREFMIGDLTIEPVSISHDAADPVAYKIRQQEKNVAVMTDLGTYDDHIVEKLQNVDVLLLEANHDVRMLQAGAYPYPLKQRILGDKGHLSNERSGQLLGKRGDPLFVLMTGAGLCWLNFGVCGGDLRLGCAAAMLPGFWAADKSLGAVLQPVFYGFWSLLKAMAGVFLSVPKKIFKIAKNVFASAGKWVTIGRKNSQSPGGAPNDRVIRKGRQYQNRLEPFHAAAEDIGGQSGGVFHAGAGCPQLGQTQRAGADPADPGTGRPDRGPEPQAGRTSGRHGIGRSHPGHSRGRAGSCGPQSRGHRTRRRKLKPGSLNASGCLK